MNYRTMMKEKKKPQRASGIRKMHILALIC